MSEQNEAKAPRKEKAVKVTIKGIKVGEGMQYATSGLHVAAEHRQYLPKKTVTNTLGRKVQITNRKMVPGVVYELPKSVADEYLGDYLEIAKK